jgi:hypothetical protein
MDSLPLIVHLPPLWLPESKTLAVEASRPPLKMLCLIPIAELQRRYKTRLDLSEDEALAVFNTFLQDIEEDIRALLTQHGVPGENDAAGGPIVLNLGARSAPWCLPASLATAVAAGR